MRPIFVAILLLHPFISFAAGALSEKLEWELYAVHETGFVPREKHILDGERLNRALRLWVYIKNCSNLTRRFPTRGFTWLVQEEDGTPLITLFFEELENPLNLPVVVGPDEYAFVEVPPGSSVLLHHSTKAHTAFRTALNVELDLTGMAAKAVKIENIRLKCSSVYVESVPPASGAK